MALTSGTRLGPYEISGLLGAGGMGEVYRARDTRLDRRVAIKILPDALAADPAFRARFDREARTISQLTHPHICTLYDVGDDAGTPYLVMELLDGQTLADRLKRSALPIAEALTIAIQIASALDKAHRAGIVHRDLKPGNIMLTTSGPKLLDFGLAKAAAPAVSGAGLSMLPTTPPFDGAQGRPGLTAQGTILGTFQYMAPEQLEGQEADARTDLFAFGAVLYEMITGRKPFEGKSHASVIAAIMHMEPPPIASSQPLVPTALDRAVTICLAKDPDDRWQTARDLGRELTRIGEEEPRSKAVPTLPRRGVRTPLAWALAGVLAVGLAAATIALILGTFARPIGEDTTATAIRFSVPTQSSDPSSGSFALSPDGRSLAFVDGTNPPQLYLRSLDTLEALAIGGTDGAQFPFWSADNRFIGFWARGALRQIAVAGGPPRMICEVTRVSGATWNQNDVILFGAAGGLFQVPAAGGTPSIVLEGGVRTSALRWPQFLPDGRRFLYFHYHISDKTGDTGIYASSLDRKEITKVMATDYMARYTLPGHVLYVQDGSLMAQNFDLETLEPSGSPIPVAHQVGVEPSINQRSASFSVSSQGGLVYAGRGGLERLVWLDRSGKQVGLVGAPDNYYSVEMSPDGSQVALEIFDRDGRGDLWTLDLARGTRQALSRTPDVWEFTPHWSPDGRYLAYSSSREPGTTVISKRLADGSGAEETLAAKQMAGGGPTFVQDWSPDGWTILLVDPRGRFESLGASNDHAPLRLPRIQLTGSEGRFSPDGRWIAYVSNESGQNEVYVQPVSGGRRVVVSTAGGTSPRWRRDGVELYYQAPGNALMAVTVEGRDDIHLGLPQELFQLPSVRNGGGGRSAYTTLDGKRFLVRMSQGETSSSMTWVLGWTTGLGQ